MKFTKYEEDYIKDQLDADSIYNQAEKIYERRLESSRYHEYQPVYITCGTFVGSRLVVEVNGNYMTGIFLRN